MTTPIHSLPELLDLQARLKASGRHWWGMRQPGKKDGNGLNRPLWIVDHEEPTELRKGQIELALLTPSGKLTT
jgi:hypothetical protein